MQLEIDSLEKHSIEYVPQVFQINLCAIPNLTSESYQLKLQLAAIFIFVGYLCYCFKPINFGYLNSPLNFSISDY